jgi:hypothetical protein
MNFPKLALVYLTSFFLVFPLFSEDAEYLDPNDIDSEVYYCYYEPDLDELLVRANTISDPVLSNQILMNILSIRPNCIDVHQSISLNFAKMNDMKNYRKAELRFRKLQTEYNMMIGNFPKTPNYRMSEPNNSSRKQVLTQKPSPENKIQYWRWIYIYSQEKR